MTELADAGAARTDRRDAILGWTIAAVLVQLVAPCFGAPLGVVFGAVARRAAGRDLRAMDDGTVSSSRRPWIAGSDRVARVAVWAGVIQVTLAALGIASSALGCVGVLGDGGGVLARVLEPIASFLTGIGAGWR